MKKIITLFAFLFYLNINAQYTKLADFGSSAINGSLPTGSLISDGTFLYGMTWQGGTSGVGNIFKILPNGTGYVDLFNFTGTANGSKPLGSLISDGTFFYGMCSGGGTTNGGTIFKIMPNGTSFTKLFDFNGTVSGGSPSGSLIYDSTFLYGMTNLGGTYNKGVIFKIKKNGTGFIKLLDFDGTTNGSNPTGSLLYDGTFLYGMTFSGGANNLGTIFKIDTSGTNYTKLLDFTGAPDAMNPRGDFFYDGTFLSILISPTVTALFILTL